MKLRFKTTIYRLISIILIFIFLVFLINTPIFDVKVNPKITEILKQKPLPEIEGNAYYAIWGINAASNKDMLKTGYQLIERYQKNRLANKDELTQEDYNEILNAEDNIDQQWLDKYGNCQSKVNNDCLGKLAKIISESPIKSPRLKLMQQRFEQIINIEAYANFNDITIGTPLPNFSYLFRLGNLKKAELYRLPEKTAFLLQIRKEMKFFKMQLTHGEMILDQMIAQAYIRNNIRYLSNYMRDFDVPANELTIIESLLTPLTKNELDISNGYISESRSLFKAINADDSFDLDTLLLQKNDYMNLLYKYFTEPNVKLSKMSSTALLKAIKTGYVDSIFLKKKSLLSYSPSSLYNYSGKAMLTNGFCDRCWNYTSRLHDLNNMISLAKLQLELKINRPTNIQQALLSSIITNNYTKKAFDYNANENSISFQCLEDNYSDCAIKL